MADSPVDALSSQELRFGARLAHTEKAVRDRTVASLSSFLASREEMPQLEMLKVWKGLFYCMWMADKAPVQNELSENLARLVHDFQGDLGLEFVRAFLVTMEREWGGIDVLRMDKFYYLIRRVVRELFSYAARREWADGTAEAVAGLLAEGPMRIPASSAAPASIESEQQAALATSAATGKSKGAKEKKKKKKKEKPKTDKSWTKADTRDPNINWVPAPRGLCYHIIDIVWSELRGVCGDTVPAAAYPVIDVLVLLCAFSPDRILPGRVADKLLVPIVEPELAEGDTVPFAVRNPHIVVMVAERLAELAKAKTTRATNRDLLYVQSDQFRQFAAYLQSLAEEAGASDEEEEEEAAAAAAKGRKKAKSKGSSAAAAVEEKKEKVTKKKKEDAGKGKGKMAGGGGKAAVVADKPKKKRKLA